MRVDFAVNEFSLWLVAGNANCIVGAKPADAIQPDLALRVKPRHADVPARLLGRMRDIQIVGLT